MRDFHQKKEIPEVEVQTALSLDLQRTLVWEGIEVFFSPSECSDYREIGSTYHKSSQLNQAWQFFRLDGIGKAGVLSRRF